MIDNERLATVMSKPLLKGSHSPDGEMCVMEAVAYIAGEAWSDHPACASPVLTTFCVAWNDALCDEDRQILKPYIPRLVNTRASMDVELKRSWMALDWLCRVSAPTWLRAAGLVDHAKKLEALVPVIDITTVKVALPVLVAARDAARDAAWDAARAAAWDAAWDATWDAARDAAGAAAGDAAWAAAWDAARDAARDATWDAARDAAGAAAGDAARDATWDAAWAAAGAAARDALHPTVVELQKSALELLDAMIAAGGSLGAEPQRPQWIGRQLLAALEVTA